MKRPTLIDRYLFAELLPPFGINLVFFTFVFLMTRILEVTNLVVNYRIELGAVALMLLYAMPQFLEFVVPMSVMMAVLLTLLRMSGDNEIVALKTGGISVYRLLPPVMAFAVLGFAITAFMTLYGSPWGRSGFNALVRRASNADLNLVVKERTFNDAFDGVMLFVSRVDPATRELVDVFIEDQRHAPLKVAIVAPRGRLMADPDTGGYRLRLFAGTLQRVDLAGRTSDTIGFDSYDVAVAVKTGTGSTGKASRSDAEMGPWELARFIDRLERSDPRYFSALVTWHQRLAIPAACLCLGFMALPMGVQSRSGRRSFGLALGLASFLAYYLLLSAGKVTGESGTCPPVVGMWLPNVFSAVLGVWLMRRCSQDRPVQWTPWGTRR